MYRQEYLLVSSGINARLSTHQHGDFYKLFNTKPDFPTICIVCMKICFCFFVWIV